jgi:hypothetical protein
VPCSSVLTTELAAHIKRCNTFHQQQRRLSAVYYCPGWNEGHGDDALFPMLDGAEPASGPVPAETPSSALRLAYARSLGQDAFLDLIRRIRAAVEQVGDL